MSIFGQNNIKIFGYNTITMRKQSQLILTNIITIINIWSQQSNSQNHLVHLLVRNNIGYIIDTFILHTTVVVVMMMMMMMVMMMPMMLPMMMVMMVMTITALNFRLRYWLSS